MHVPHPASSTVYSSRNVVQLSKPQTTGPTVQCYRLYLGLSCFPHNVPFQLQNPAQDPTSLLAFCVSLDSSSLWQFLSLSLASYDLDTWVNAGQSNSSSSHLGWEWSFLIRLQWCISGIHPREVMSWASQGNINTWCWYAFLLVILTLIVRCRWCWVSPRWS